MLGNVLRIFKEHISSIYYTFLLMICAIDRNDQLDDDYNGY
jgi:hypothetical protein